MNKIGDLIGEQEGRAEGIGAEKPPTTATHLAARWRRLAWFDSLSAFSPPFVFSHFQCKDFILFSSPLLLLSPYIDTYIYVWMELEHCGAVGPLMTVKFIYSPLKVLHHRELQRWPSGIGSYAFHVFSQ